MVHYKLDVTDLYSPDFELIAIHSKMEDYRLAFFLNKKLFIRLQKSEESAVQYVKNEAFLFSRFEFEDEKNQSVWTLVENKKTKQSIGVFGNLFMDFESVKHSYLVPELKKADYLLKVEGDFNEQELEALVSKTKEINDIQMAYAVQTKQIKSKNNLIF
ncbi:MAG: IPExxxVDY family protein [Flavobacteriales bacterium]|nr:IPExxxVDY family protein [Flavobacteriales bacterium]